MAQTSYLLSIKREKNRTIKWDILHIYGQYAHHGEAYIVGNKRSLLALAWHLIKAALTGISAHKKCMQNDGEGFNTYVIRVGRENERLASAYTAEYCQTYSDDDNPVVYPSNLISWRCKDNGKLVRYWRANKMR